MSFKKKRKIIRKKEIPHCHVKIKANKPSTYSTLVSLWLEYSMLFSVLQFIVIVDQLQEPEHSELPKTEKNVFFTLKKRRLIPVFKV